ncbi:hypothetical protein GE061_019473 [Apolygus lucorum]|uniref:Uncharacterized protein n=1 Tax=Apolygus lucorum TaxID=248454 RepID=A0A8S9X8N8_APOLU|nr:hypothetical protein GE061_019473 [Apolygus lucorum]
MVAFVKMLAERLSDKWSRPQGAIREWLRARIAFAVLRATSMCIRGSRKRWRTAEELLGFRDGAALQMDLAQDSQYTGKTNKSIARTIETTVDNKNIMAYLTGVSNRKGEERNDE